MIVHQVLSGAGPHDAVTQQALSFRRLFDAWGWGGGDHAAAIDPRIGSSVRDLEALRSAPRDTLLVHFSAYAPRLGRIFDQPGRKVLLSHNVTPARWLWDHDPMAAVQCALGRRQMHEWAARCDVVAGVSAYNAAELRSDRVVPILFDPARFTADLSAPTAEKGSDPFAAAGGLRSEVLFVGRLAPHKRQDELVRLLALLRSDPRPPVPEAQLRLVGEPLNAAYGEALRDLAARAAPPGAVAIESGLDREALVERYRRADLFVCLSEHEGFCIPLLEAFASGLPVIARANAAVPEIAGDAALLVPPDEPIDAVAELCALALEDAALRDELVARGRRRLEAFDAARTATALRALLER